MRKSFLKTRAICFMLFLTVIISSFSFMMPLQINAASKIDTSGEVKLKWILVGNGTQEDNDLVFTEINKYLKKKINASVDVLTFTWADFTNKMLIYMAAGENYDIGYTSNWSVNFNRIASIGLYRDITDMLDTYAPKSKALLGEKVLKGAALDGRIYGLPVYNSNIVGSFGLLLNKKLVDKYKVNTAKIKKLQDLEPIMKKIKADNSKIINFYPFDPAGSEGIINTLDYEQLIANTPAGVLKDGKSTRVVNIFESVQANSLFTLLNKWYKAGYIPKSAPANNAYFRTNKANIFALYSSINCQTGENMRNENGIEMIPVSLTKPYISTDGVQNNIQSVSCLSKNPERALMLLELANTDEKFSNMLNYGLEGIHYKKTGAKTIAQLSPRYNQYNPGTPWEFGNQTLTYSTPGHSPGVWTTLKENIKAAAASPFLGRTFDPAPVINEIALYTNIQQRYLTDLYTGKADPASVLPELNSELKKAGLQEFLAEMQKQADTFVNPQKK